MKLNRRDVVVGGLAAMATGASGFSAHAAASSYFAGTAVDNGVTYRTTNFAKIDKKWHRQVVKYKSSEPVGTVVVDTSHHFLYLIIENKTAIRYGVGVGREGFKWFGRANDRPQGAVAEMDAAAGDARAPSRNCRYSSKAARRRTRSAPAPCTCSATASIPAIASTARWSRGSIGTDASSGCIRMFNEERHRSLPALPDRHRRAGSAAHRRPGARRDERSGRMTGFRCRLPAPAVLACALALVASCTSTKLEEPRPAAECRRPDQRPGAGL